MHGSPSRSVAAGLRVGLFVLGAATLLALTPPPASGASVIVAGKPVPIVSDELIAIFDRWGKRIPPKTSLNFAKIDAEYKTAVDAAFRATDGKVTQTRLASIGTELKLPIPPMRSR